MIHGVKSTKQAQLSAEVYVPISSRLPICRTPNNSLIVGRPSHSALACSGGAVHHLCSTSIPDTLCSKGASHWGFFIISLGLPEKQSGIHFSHIFLWRRESSDYPRSIHGHSETVNQRTPLPRDYLRPIKLEKPGVCCIIQFAEQFRYWEHSKFSTFLKLLPLLGTKVALLPTLQSQNNATTRKTSLSRKKRDRYLICRHVPTKASFAME